MADQGISRLVEKIGTLNSRLDTIIGLLSSTGQKKLNSTEIKTEKNKVAKTLAPVKEKNVDLATKKIQKNTKPKSKKKPKQTKK